MLFITFSKNEVKIVLLNESKRFLKKKKRKKCGTIKGKLKMKIETSPNQNLIEFVFIGVFVSGKVSCSEEID